MKKLFLFLAVVFLSVSSFAMEELQDETFVKKISKTNNLAVVDVYTTWCGPCKAYAPMLEQAEKDFKGKIVFFKIDLDKNPIVAKAAKIQKIPTTMLFYKGHYLARIVGGAENYNQVKQTLQLILNNLSKYDKEKVQ